MGNIENFWWKRGLPHPKPMLGKRVSEETKLKLSRIFKGRKPANFHLLQTPEYIRKSAEARIGLKMSFEVKKKISEKLKGRLFSLETRKKISNNAWLKGTHIQVNNALEKWRKAGGILTGEKNHNWKGGITPINAKIRNSIEGILWRKFIFKRDNYVCVWCKQLGGKLHADHIKPFAWYPNLRFDTNNGQTLCKECHSWKTKMDLKIYRGRVPELNYI
jgi:hypothetical protein